MSPPDTTWPLVSVIVPCYNNAETVISAVNSVLLQDYPNIEVLVIDDGSTDNSVEILATLERKIILLQQENKGSASARNTGLLAATGQFIAFNDSDDLWLPGKLSAQINFLQQHQEIGLCYCGWMEWDGKAALISETKELVDHAPKLSKKQPGNEGWLYLDLLKESVIHTITLVMRREVVDVVGLFNTDYTIGEDYDYWIRASQYYRIAKLKQVFALYRNSSAGITKKVHNKNFRLMVLEAAIARYGLNCPSGEKFPISTLTNHLNEAHFSYGYNAMLQGHRVLAMASLKICIRKGYRFSRACLLYSICVLPWFYNHYIKYKKRKRIID